MRVALLVRQPIYIAQVVMNLRRLLWQAPLIGQLSSYSSEQSRLNQFVSLLSNTFVAQFRGTTNLHQLFQEIGSALFAWNIYLIFLENLCDFIWKLNIFLEDCIVYQLILSLDLNKYFVGSLNQLIMFPGGGRVSLYYWLAFIRLWKNGGLQQMFSAQRKQYPDYE